MSGPILFALRIAVILALYTFLAWALYTMWQDLKRQVRSMAERQAPPLTLVGLAENERRTYRFTQPEVTIGRDPACEWHLEDKTISAQHARLSFHHGQWWVEDLHSTNGTFLNQNPVAEPLVITLGDQLRCGQLEFVVGLSDSGPEEHKATETLSHEHKTGT